MTGLNFDSIPKLDVPLRFYLTAPFFALVASLMLIEQGSALWLTRWLPSSLAVTHLIALGVIAMIMVGSLFQIMPVLCGTPIRISKWPLRLMHLGLVTGTLALSFGFVGWIPFVYGFVLLGLSVGYFVLSLSWTLVKYAQGEQTRFPILLALFSFALVLAAGLLLLSGYLWGVQPAVGKALTNFHASIGVFGWILLLIMGVSFQVIPMFHVTPVFLTLWRRGLIYGSAIALVIMALFTFIGAELYYVGIFNALIGIAYAIIGSVQLTKRKRKLPDVVINYWQVAYANLCIGCMIIIILPLVTDSLAVKLEVLLAMLLAFGFVLGVIQGMLLKIVPFLITLHLQSIAMKNPASMMMLPDHYSLLSRKQGKVQYWLYITLLISVALSFFFPFLSSCIGMFFLLNWLVIGYNVGNAFIRYKRIEQQMLARCD
jgi:hypothetical protein